MAYTDTFTNTNGTYLEDHSANWVCVSGSDEIAIQSNTIIGSASSNTIGAYYYNQTANSKHYSQVKFAVSSNGGGGPAIRVQSGNNFYYCLGFLSDKLYCGQSISGSYTDWDSGLTVPATNSVLRMEADATTETTIIVKDDGSTIATYTGKSALSGGKPGVCQWESNGYNDNWEGGDVVTEITLTVANAAHAHTAQALTLTQAHTLAVANAAHAQAASNVVLELDTVTLTVANAAHAQTAQAPTLTQAHTLAVANAAHAQAAEAPTLTQAHTLAAANAAHAQTAEALTLTQAHALEVASAEHVHTTEAPTLTQAHTLAVESAEHAHAADNVVLEAAGTLAVASAEHVHTAQAPALTQAHTLAVTNAAHAHTAQALTLTQIHALAVANAAHMQTANNVTLTQAHALAVASAAHAQTAEAPALTQAHALAVANAAHAHTASNVSLGGGSRWRGIGRNASPIGGSLGVRQ